MAKTNNHVKWLSRLQSEIVSSTGTFVLNILTNCVLFFVTPIEPQDVFFLAFVIVFYNKHRTFPVDPVFFDWVKEFIFSVCDFLINSLDLTLFPNPVAIDLKSTFTPVNDVV